MTQEYKILTPKKQKFIQNLKIFSLYFLWLNFDITPFTTGKKLGKPLFRKAKMPYLIVIK